MERSTVHTLLHDLAESPAPPSTVDIRRATAAGRRTVRLRRVLTGGAAALAVAAIAGVLSVVISGGAGVAPGPAPVGSASDTPAPPDRPMPDQAPTAFDPLVQYPDLGWVPAGSLGRGVTVARDWVAVTADYQGLPTGPGNDAAPGGVVLLVATAGRGLDPSRHGSYAVDPAAMAAGTTAEPVSGRSAEWSDGFGTTLRWQYAPGTWAAVVVHNIPGVNEREVARRVATDVQFGVDLPMRLPFRTTAVPASLTPAMVSVYRHDAGWSAHVQYGNTRTQYGDWPLSILAVASDAETGDGAVIGDPTTTVDGYPARTSTGLDGGSGLQLFNVNGVYLEMLTHSPQTTAELQGGLVGLFRSMEIYPDPATWR